MILDERRKVLRQILESQYDDSDSMTLIELLFGNVQTQDNEFIKKLKERLHYRFSGGHSNTADICEDEIDKLTGFALHESKDNKNVGEVIDGK